jgi:hypothetical protein
VNKTKRLRQTGDEARIREKINTNTNSSRKPEEEKSVGKPRGRKITLNVNLEIWGLNV